MRAMMLLEAKNNAIEEMNFQVNNKCVPEAIMYTAAEIAVTGK